MLISKMLIRCSAHTTFTMHSKNEPTVNFLAVHLTFTQSKCEVHIVLTQCSNKLLSDSAHLIKTDLMGHEDSFLTLVPKSVKS